MLGRNSARIQVVVSKKELVKISSLARQQNRSISNWAALIIRNELRRFKVKSISFEKKKKRT